MEWIETTAKTIDEAKEVALDQLGVDEGEAEFEVVEEPKTGLFGRSRGVARVRARVIPKAPRPKHDRKRRSKTQSGDSALEGQKSSGQRSNGQKSNGQKKASQSAKKSPSAPGSKAKEALGSAAASAAGSAGDDSSRRNDRETGQSKSDRQAQTDGAHKERAGARSAESRQSREPREKMPVDEQISAVEEFLSGLSEQFAVTASVEATLEDSDLRANLVGSDLGILVGPRLATLEALQELTRLTLQRAAQGREYARVTVDVAGIRERRRAALEEFVADVSQRVREEQKVIVFEDMSSADRKQVHDLAAALEGIRSVSEGEDPRRRVVLKPAVD